VLFAAIEGVAAFLFSDRYRHLRDVSSTTSTRLAASSRRQILQVLSFALLSREPGVADAVMKMGKMVLKLERI
jgi:hypothetical protein